MIGERLSSVPGSSRYFLGGFITYSDAMKIELLGVDPELLAHFGAVSRETAEAMAAGARRRANSTYALAVTGVAGPETPGDRAPVGTVYVGLADAEKAVSFHRQFLGDRPRIRAFTAQMAIDLLRRKLLGRP
jgi:nicotinamide-nucleotide amidase